MKFLKVLLGIVVILVVAVLIAGIAIDSNYNVERSAVIEGCRGDIVAQVTDYNNWPSWSPWREKAEEMGHEVEYTFSENQNEVGAWYSWKSDPKGIGSGKVSTTAMSADTMEFLLEFIEPMQGEASGYMAFASADKGTNVTWNFHGENNFIGKIFFTLVGAADGLGADFEKGLSNITQIMSEKEMDDFAPEEITLTERYYLGKRVEMNLMNLTSQDFADNYGAIMGHMFQSNMSMDTTYYPMTVYREFNDETMDAVFDFAIPVGEKPAEAEGFVSGLIAAGTYLAGNHYGHYEKTGDMWEKMEAYLHCHNIRPTGAPFEAYVTDPALETDTAKWLTQVLYPIGTASE